MNANGTRPRGTGSLKLVNGTWFARYYSNGTRHHESTHTADKDAAERWLRRRLKTADTGGHVTPDAKRLRVNDLLQLVADDYRRKGNKSRIKYRAKHLRDHFAGWRAMHVTTVKVEEYADERREMHGAAVATVNRELALLRRGFSLAVDKRMLPADMRPIIRTAPEDNVRQGFLEISDLDPFLDALRRRDPAVADVVAVAFLTCLRRANVLGLTWDRFAFEFAPASTRIVGGELRLPGTATKNKKPLTLPLTGRLLDVVARRYDLRRGPHVFQRGDGRAVRRFVAVWRDATAEVGRPGFLFHDLRRSGARALRQLGVDELTIMALGGWKTRSMFARYSIVDTADLADAQSRLDAALANPGTPKVTALHPVSVPSASRTRGHAGSLGVTREERAPRDSGYLGVCRDRACPPRKG
jgi:integrase